MPATAQNLKDFFALSGNNPPVTNAQLTALNDWLTDMTDKSGADGLVDHVYETLKQQVISHKRRQQSITF